MASAEYYLPAIVLALILAIRLPNLVRARRDPLVRSVCLVLAFGGAGFLFAAPPTVAAVNRASGIPNFSGPLVYALVSSYSASCLLLIVNWRGGSPDYIRRVSRRWTAGYAVVIAALIVLFFLGRAPADRLTDLDTYYARTPYIGEMILLYLLGHMTAAVATTVLCWRWALQVGGWLRAGLWVLVAGWLLNLGFSLFKLMAVVARWTGRDWDVLSTIVAPRLAGPAAALVALGFMLPLTGPWATTTWRALTAYRRLGPLWRELAGAAREQALVAPVPWYWSPQLRLTRREAGIADGLSLVRPYLDERVGSQARTLALAEGRDPADAASIGHAAVIAAAARGARHGAAPSPSAGTGHLTLPSGRELLAVSRALRRSSIVAAVRRAPLAAGTGTDADTTPCPEDLPRLSLGSLAPRPPQPARTAEQKPDESG
ncbi:MAB_1171c family putative transporter [Streptomyces nodosus]|uniref:MAB_1171c family putative transporter n=1 Tax=Streptomyces nodosus TaxID=40318 RepID=UPI003821587C